MRGFHPYCYYTFLSRSLARSLGKRKSLFFDYHNIYGHKIRHDGDLTWVLLTNKVQWPYNHVVLWDHVTNEKHFISTTKMLMATIRGRMMTYLEWLLPIKSHDHIVMWSCKITWQTKIITHLLINTIPMTINFGRVGIYNEEFPSMKLLDPLITCTWKVM